ncbi:DMT family transporter [Motilimonas sp. 1_MG-2023]|uniref:DMT family transporter n=1 Tax=Motilimonas TaxID=1914248 RepID=UPI0026E1C01D|nr:DMT family transporter [Motilimonas sp. 1_MG-2023]MDO6527010.1 DMT family transporter [Motilimonas sp. 1_MG-2023]
MRSYMYLLGIGLLWGSQFIFMHQALIAFPPLVVAASRALCGFVTLVLVCRILGLKSEKFNWLVYMSIALLDATLPFVLVAWGQQYVDSAVAAVTMGTIPFMTLLLAPLVLKSEKISLWGMISVALGFAGIVVLFAPQLAAASSLLWPILAILFGAACFALGMLMIKRFASEAPLLVARNILACAALQLSVLALVTQDFGAIVPETNAILSLLTLGIFCTGLVYFLFMALIQLSGPTFASFSNYLVPLFGMLLGALWLNEQISHTTLIALVIILGSVALNQWASQRDKKRIELESACQVS